MLDSPDGCVIRTQNRVFYRGEAKWFFVLVKTKESHTACAVWLWGWDYPT